MTLTCHAVLLRPVVVLDQYEKQVNSYTASLKDVGTGVRSLVK